MKIGVTGATGHVGTNLTRMLLQEGHTVKVLIHRDGKGLAGLPLEMVHGNVLNLQDLIRLTEGCDVIFNLAASITIYRHDVSSHRLNVDSCKNLIQASGITGVKKIIHFSSIHAFRQKPLDSELNETRELTLKGNSSYDLSKAQSQKMMQEASTKGMEVVVLNPTAIVGPYDFKPSLVGNAIIRFYKGLNPGLIPGGYNWVDVRDVCKAAVNAINKGKGGESYLLPGSWQSLEVLAEEISGQGGHQPPLLHLPGWLAQLGLPFLNIHARLTGKPPLYTSISLETLQNSHRHISGEKAASALDFNPRPFVETITDTVTWFKENSYI
jgi:dihydroflavonol-4-reductase